jgi:glucan 1,4-alpha-glucosidase
MKKIILYLSVCLVLFVSVHAQTLRSPGGEFMMVFALESDGTPTYTLRYKDRDVIKPIKLGLELEHDKQSLLNGFEITKTDTGSFDGTWKPVPLHHVNPI